MCSKEQQTSNNLIVKNNCFIIEISDKCSFSAVHKAVYTGLDRFGIGPRLGPGRPCVHTRSLGTGTVKATYRYKVAPLAKKSRYGPGPVQVSCEPEEPVPLWIELREGHE